MPVLYIVATPIGNLEDITLRALRILREVALIAAEDTRKTKRLLNAYGIKTPVTSYYEHNKKSKLNYILKYLENDKVALVSEAGTPGMSDPGYELTIAASQRDIPVIPIPGPSAIITALTVSGLPTHRVTFIGFLPHKVNDRQRVLKSLANETGTIIVLESPHRIPAALNDILLVLGDRKLAVCRELTKLHEEIFRGTVSEAKEHFTTPKGEFTLVIKGNKNEDKPRLTEDIEKQLLEMQITGVTAKEATARIAGETGLSRRELYQAWVKSGKIKELQENSGRFLERSK